MAFRPTRPFSHQLELAEPAWSSAHAMSWLFPRKKQEPQQTTFLMRPPSFFTGPRRKILSHGSLLFRGKVRRRSVLSISLEGARSKLRPRVMRRLFQASIHDED